MIAKLTIASVSSSTGGVYFALTDAVSIAVVTQLGALALAGLAAFISWKTHKAVNSRMDEFKAMFAQAKINEGVLQEKAGESKRKGDVAEAMLNVNVNVKGEKLVTAFSEPTAQSGAPPQPVILATAEITKAIKAVPDRTAVKVVEKLEEKKG